MRSPERSSTIFEKRIVAGPRSAYVTTCGMHCHSGIDRIASSQVAALR